ncbi:MAG: PD-(D/E)XK nuclease family protein [bacterium]|nr:PD-(D/E)XK nuclease family protein [bacterium]
MTASMQLSQSALSSFSRCRRRFFLRFVRRLEWPAPLTGSEQEWERSLRRGEQLHLFIEQAALGMDVQGLVEEAGDEQLSRWWNSAVEHPPAQPTGDVHTELELMVPFGEHRLVARFDRLIVAQQGDSSAIHILDWKTGTPQQASRLARSWQTTIYQFVAVEASPSLTAAGIPVRPASVGFTYWQAEAPQSPVVLTYDEAAHKAGRQRIAAEIAHIEQRLNGGEDSFERTTDLDACRHCLYRSYCERGREPPPGIDLDEDFEEGPDGSLEEVPL